MRLIVSIICLCYVAFLQAQVDCAIYLDSSRMTVGDQQYVHIAMQYPMQGNIDTSFLKAFDTISWIEVLDKTSKDTLINNNRFFVRDMLFSAFDTGSFTFPVLEMTGTDGVQLFTKSCTTAHLRVDYVDSNVLDILPPKDIIEEGIHWSYYAFFGLALLCILSMFIALWYLFGRRKRIVPPLVFQQIKSPTDVALEELQILNGLQLWQQGKMKEYYDGLSLIFRKYLENGLSISALDRTSGEIVKSIEDVEFGNFDKQALNQFFQASDIVKFSNVQYAITEAAQHSQLLEDTIRKHRAIADNLAEQRKQTWRILLGDKLASQFEYPDEMVPSEILHLFKTEELGQIELISGLHTSKTFTLPLHVIQRHTRQLGYFNAMHLDLIRWSGTNVLKKICIIPALCFILPFIPFRVLMRSQGQKSAFHNSLFLLSKQELLCINPHSKINIL